MMKTIKNYLYILLSLILITSCLSDLDVDTIDPRQTSSNKVFNDDAAYKQALAKIYSSFAVTGQNGGGGGNPEIHIFSDQNFTSFVRIYWEMQELSTDEAIIAWDDQTIKNFHWQTWAPNDRFIYAMYLRIYYSIGVANEFIRNVNSRLESASGDFLVELETYKAEARLLRAFSYWNALDLFGNVPFVNEDNIPGAFFPERITRAELFNYIVSEINDIENTLVNSRENEYGRVDRGVAWMLLAKLYMNAKVYTGTEMYDEALAQINKVLNGGYSIDPDYNRLFCADNHESPEIIFPITFDGQNTQQYGGMTFMLHASNGGGMPLNGIDGGWGGIRTISDFVQNMFNVNESDFSSSDPEFEAITDKRGMFYFNPDNWEWDITNVGTFTQGVGVTKFKNVTSTGGSAPNSHPTFVSTDFPVFRLGDAYLMYAEATLRGASGGNTGTALSFVNELRERAYGNTSGNINMNELTLDFILDERGRELYWEAHRRTDLIRFGKFTGGDYVWEWKGNTQEGTATASYRDLYPIPSDDRNANPNLEQNYGYN